MVNNVLFVVDKSGSNVPFQGDPGTDPTKSIRGGALEEFFSANRGDPSFRWGFIYFSGVRVDAYIKNGSGAPLFASATEMAAALTQFYADPDIAGSLGTDYTKALALVDSAVRNDIDQRRAALDGRIHYYNIFFVSDGYPNENGVPRPILDDSDPRIRRIEGFRGLDPSRIYLSTAYYAPANYQPQDRAIAVSGLQLMAKAGGGRFTDIRETGRLQFRAIQGGERQQAWIIKGTRIVSYNLNAGYCRDGQIGVDSDADGLCDRDEILFNDLYKYDLGGKRFDPQNRHSLNAQYSDGFVWLFDILPSGPGLPECVYSGGGHDDDLDFLKQCEEEALRDQSANGPTTAWTNELLEQGGGRTNPNYFDTDGDGFIDGIEFLTFLMEDAVSAAVNFNNSMKIYGGSLTGAEVMYRHRHFMNPDVVSPSSYDTTLVFKGKNTDGHNCYQFQQKRLGLYKTAAVDEAGTGGHPQLAHASGENKVLVYYIATPDDDPNGKGVLFYDIQTFHIQDGRSEGSTGLRLDEFQIYEPPGVLY